VSQNDFIAVDVDATPEIHKQGDKSPSRRIYILYSPPIWVHLCTSLIRNEAVINLLAKGEKANRTDY